MALVCSSCDQRSCYIEAVALHIHIVIPVHNRREYVRGCLASLREQTFSSFSIVVVDDGSTDGTSKMIADGFPDVVVLPGDGDLWWTGAINEGVRHVLEKCSPDDYILALNDDLLVPPNYLETLACIAADNPKTLIGSVVTDIAERDKVLAGEIRVNFLTAAWSNPSSGAPLASFPRGYLAEASTLTGRGTLIPSEVFRELGPYDRRHFKQCGDTELPIRAHDAGYRLVVSYDAQVWSYTDDGNPRNINTTHEYRISDLRRYFFDVKSNMNVVTRFWFAWTTRRNAIQALIYYTFDIARVVGRFFRHLRLTSSRH